MNSVAVLLTVYNRKEVTLRGLRSLYVAIEHFSQDYVFDIYMVDDGCTDGTSEAVAVAFPQIHIIKGNGSLYWGGGMNLAWETASKEKDYDYYLWFNDDAELYPNAIDSLFVIEHKEKNITLVCGVFEDENHNVSYGGKDKNTRLLPLNSNEDVYYMNGNLVLIPNVIFKTVGNIDKLFIHGHGDYDYGLRALKKGYLIRLTGIYIGMTSRHDIDSRKIYDKNISLIERLVLLYSPKYNPLISFRFHLRHRGLLYAIIKFLRKNIATIFPSLYSTIRG